MDNNTNWLNISSQSGSSGQTILTLSANKNLSMNYKTAEITAYNPVYNISAKTYVTLESYAPILSISPGLFGVPDSGGTYELTISANCTWVIAFPDLVTSYSTSAGTGNAVVTFTVPGTTADTTLAGNIVVTDESGQVSRTAKVEQYGSGVHIGIFPVELYFDSTGGSKTFSVTADAAYNVSVGSGTDWAFVEPHSGYTGQTTFTVTVNSENTGTTDKQGVINIDAPGQDLAVILYQKKPETRLVVGYYVTSTTDPTVLMYSGALSSVSQMEYPDGTQITPATAYTFPSTGMQYVYYTLTGDTIPQNMFNGTGAYMNDKETIREVYVPEGVTSIAYGAFRDCFELTAVTLPGGLLTVGEDAFRGCISLPDITFPEGLLHIGTRAFDSDNELHTIVIPSSVTGIGSYAFTASSVSSITFNSLTPPTLGNANALSSGTLSEIIVPCPAVNDYITAWPQYAQYISCSDTGTTLYFITDTSNVKGVGEVRTITILNTNINENRTGLELPGAFPQQGAYTVSGNVIYLTYPQNPSTSNRTWTIGVVAQTKDGVSLKGAYRITQNGLVTNTIPWTADTSTVSKSGETRIITIDASNLVASSITIGVEGATGVTYTYQNGVITVTFPENLGYGRDITITVDAVTNKGNLANATIVFTQESGFFLVVETTYFVTSTTENTQILYYNGRSQFSSARLEDGTNVPIATGFTFPATGLQKVYYTLINNTLADSSFGKYVSVGGTDHRAAQSKLYSIIVPEGVVSIGKGCFQGCNYLTNVVLPNSLTTLGENAFYSAGNYGYNPEYNLMNYMTVTMPDSITSIGKACFFLSGLKEAHLGTGITFIPELCFGKCNLQSLYIPDSVTGVAEANTTYGTPFEGGMKWIRLSKNTASYPYKTFSAMTGLKAIVAARNTASYPDNPNIVQDRFCSVFSKGGTLYYPCDGNYDDWYGTSGTHQYDYLSAFSWTMQCFNSESDLTTTLPISFSGETTALAQTGETRTFTINGIGYQHTYNVELQGIPGSTYSVSGDVLTITVPNNTTSTPRIIRAFVTSSAYNGELKGKAEIIITQEGPNGDTGSTSGLTGYTQNYFEGVFDIIQTSEPTKIVSEISTGVTNYIYKVMIDDTEIPLSTGFTFSTTGRKTVKCYLHSDMTGSQNPGDYYYESIGYVFSGCNRLISAIVPNTVNLYAQNFTDCTSLTSVTIPSTVTRYGTSEFRGCSNLQSISWPNNLTEIGSSAFKGCTSLSSATISSSVTKVGAYAFENCTGLQYVVFKGTEPPSFDYATFGYNSISFPVYVPCLSVQKYKSAMDSRYANNIQCMGLYYTADTSTVASSGETRTITIDTSNLIESSITVDVGTATGVTYTYQNSVITITFSPYIGERDITVTISAVALSGPDAEQEIVFTQKNEYTEPLTFIIEAEGNLYWQQKESASGSSFKRTIQRKLNDGEWVDWQSSSGTASYVHFYPGDIVQVRGNYNSYSNYLFSCSSDCRFSLKGNIMSLVQSTGFESLTEGSGCNFYRLFNGCSGITNAKDLLLPTSSAPNMLQTFRMCGRLITPPKLPATTLTKECYKGLFWGCSSLSYAPALPATTLAQGCYSNMFGSCSSITTAPELPATVLTSDCYNSMFYGCSGLTSAPELPAAKLTDRCYSNMFQSCRNLNYVKCLATNISATESHYWWLSSVSDTGTFVKDANMNHWPSGGSGIPSGWTVQNA